MSTRRPPASAADARLDALFASAERAHLSEEQKRKMLDSVLSRAQERRPWLVTRLRPAVVSGVLLIAGASAAAIALGGRWREQTPPPQHTSTSVSQRMPRPSIGAQGPALASPVAVTAPDPIRISKRVAPAPPRASAVRGGEDPARVTAAIKALRQDRDPQRADQLLREYLRTFPRGELAEEARALLIEAAVARHDPGAGDLANEYLRLYPRGRFRSSAQMTVDHAGR